MALRLQLSPPALRTLDRCPAPVRQKLQGELAELAAGLPLEGPLLPEEVGLVVLGSGFRVHYLLEQEHRLLRLTDVMAPTSH
ncbi:hypothetical protein HUA74_06760 [Myxococcus sp. CA051A]|uniref:Uncharacterized protein n=1 Tax=Myxococcus llanfairpwllgwyngyllgogerychwyrndrobwllllantysiliogogogochensis TaxID=2590453 RepID=A0A540X9Q1_9BACT|nr:MULTISPECIES: hypothetical protein [Myxococcus]NTX11083.1 hypothetical protein [Myxococcus sp. CA056]NTX02661.1 hypothetical protein [Myxococcus sp. CA040A]NTX34827.1 hypothetical protein [Myxococcus sp. CA033]NTX51769.1 hypothetical protein [Myxococcus sp. CA039A]NTX60356.1 hypothetical protein [Myxococcus sp. CA051A]